MDNLGRRLTLLVTTVLLAVPSGGAYGQDCMGGSFDGTFALIQKAIFENRGCTNALCHGAAEAGGLDLRESVSFEELIDAGAESVDGFRRVVPGQKNHSLLWLNLAAKTYPEIWTAPLRPMPADPAAPLTFDELEAVRLWIEAGAPREGVVPGTGALLDACLPPPRPISVEPLPPPAAGEGVQIHMPQWILDAQSEREVCYASYYDVTDQVPEEFRSDDGTKFRYKHRQIRQDPLSHHLIIDVYEGEATPHSEVWGEFLCRGGEHDGAPCDPVEVGACGAGAGCATTAIDAVACIGYGPPDSTFGLFTNGSIVLQETASEFSLPDDVYRELPLKGMVRWNSHAFNLTDEAGKLEGWMNLEFPAVGEQRIPAVDINDVTQIFKMNVPPFRTQEVCHIHTFQPNAHVYEISSHMHRRGKRFRMYYGAWRCDGRPCSPLGQDFASPDLCPGSPCTSTSANANDSPFYVSLVYNDPVVMSFEPPLVFPSDAPPNDRSITYCALYDNGYSDPTDVKRQSTSPVPGIPFGGPCDEPTHCATGLVGKPCAGADDDGACDTRARYGLGDCNHDATVTVDELVTGVALLLGLEPIEACADADVDEDLVVTVDEVVVALNAALYGVGAFVDFDGACDACPLTGGVTTEDEMFVLFAQYYVP